MTVLQVRVSEPRPGRTQYSYELKSGDGALVGPLEQEHTVHVSQDLVKGLCMEIDKVLKNAHTIDGAELRETLARSGRLLYDTLFPQSGQPELVRRLSESTGSLLVQSNEALVPWELLHDESDFLGLRHDLGRRTKVDRPVVTGRTIGQIRRALVVGDTLGDLTSAREEAERISAWLTERGVTCTVLTGRDATLLRVIGELAREHEPYDLFHYSGHVSGVPDAAGLMVHDRKFIGLDALQPLARRGAPPVVFINGCASADPLLDSASRAQAEAAQTMNACMAFMVVGAKTVVGTRTAVGDAGALRFAEALYGQLRVHVEAGAAVRKARAELAEQSDGAWASFVLYGDPGVRISTAAEPEPEPVAPEAERPGYTTEAAGLLRRTVQVASLRGFVTSVDLLTALLETERIRQRASARIGAKRLRLLTEVLRQLQSHTPGSSETGARDTAARDARARDTGSYSTKGMNGNGGGLNGTRSSNGYNSSHGSQGSHGTDPNGTRLNDDGGIGLSDTIARVLDGAEEAVLRDGRERVEVDDISAAFLEAGCGSCAELLQLFGIRPERLLSPTSERQGSDEDDDTVGLDGLGAQAATAVRCARLLAAVKGEKISTYLLLQAFAMTGSEALRDALAEQGEEGANAYRALAPLGRPRPREFSRRTLARLERTIADADGPVGEEALLIALLAEEDASARRLMQKLGVEPELLIQALRDSEESGVSGVSGVSGEPTERESEESGETGGSGG
ncbi:CHAT domain-containing protein [Streptomyces sp. NPDC050997]|uniref:CHAT domain-containing protein n=1 Tax=Streptomyces sp. NPDC050997 TaxID=3155519 RepID=UPI00343F847E